jgi:hypothetical protein
MPIEEQNKKLSAAFSYSAYSAQYLNGTLPPFTTSEYGVLPFKPTDAMKASPDELWLANTTLYEAGLDCTPGIVNTLPENDDDGEWIGHQLQVSNADKTCKVMIESDWADKYSPYSAWMINERFLRYRMNLLYKGEMDMLVQCSETTLKNVMIGFWGRLMPPKLEQDQYHSKFIRYAFNKTSVVFCYPRNTAQDVEVTINPKFMDIQGVKRLESTARKFDGMNVTYWNNIMVGQESAALTEKFNISTGMVIPKNRRSHWDYFRVTAPGGIDNTHKFQGLPDHTSQMLRLPQFQTYMNEFSARSMPDQAELWSPTGGSLGIASLAKKSDMFPYDPTQGYASSGYIRPINTWIPNPNSLTAFGLTRQHDLEALFDHDNLTKMFSSAYQYLFAVAVGSGLSQYTNTSLERRDGGPPSLAQRQYTQIGYIADVQWVRCLQTILAIILAILIILIVLLRNRKCNLSGDPGTLASTMASTDERVLREFEDAEFLTEKELLTQLQRKSYRYCLCENRVMVSQEPSNPVSNNSATIDHDKVTCHKPWSLTVYVGGFFAFVLLATVVLLIVLYVQNRKGGGFQIPGNDFQYNLYSSYLPTIAAMAFEAFLVLLAGHVALLYPFTQLREKRKTSAAGPLSINYDKLPPHLQLYGALKTKNYLLATLSMSVLMANIIAVALGVLFQKDFKNFYETGSLTMQGSPLAVSQFNASMLDQGVQHREYDMLYASTGDALGFKPRPWTTEEYFYLNLLDKGSDLNSRANYTAKTWGFGVDVTCNPLATTRTNDTWVQDLLIGPEKDALFFATSPGPYYHQIITSNTAMNKSGSFYAAWVRYQGKKTIDSQFFITESDTATSTATGLDISETFSASKLIPPPIVVVESSTVTSIVAAPTRSFTYFEGTKATAIAIPSSVTGSFRFTVVTATPTARKSSVTSSQSLSQPSPTSQPDPGFNIKPQIELAKRDAKIPSYHEQSRTGRFVTSNIIICNQSPRILKRQLEITNITEGVIRREGDIDNTAVPQPNDVTGLNNIITNFKTMLLRVNSLDSESTFLEPGPQNWIAYLVQQDGLRLNSDFTLYDNPEESARAMERVYKRLFAIYMQLHSDEIFKPANKPEESVVGGTFFRKDSRVVMGTIAFWTAAALILLCVPITLWTYGALFNGFVVHQPTSLAGTYASFYASDALDDVAGTEGIRSAERAKRLKALGHTYGYGWFISKDSKKHYGIHRADKRDFGWIV